MGTPTGCQGKGDTARRVSGCTEAMLLAAAPRFPHPGPLIPPVVSSWEPQAPLLPTSPVVSSWEPQASVGTACRISHRGSVLVKHSTVPIYYMFLIVDSTGSSVVASVPRHYEPCTVRLQWSSAHTLCTCACYPALHHGGVGHPCGSHGAAGPVAHAAVTGRVWGFLGGPACSAVFQGCRSQWPSCLKSFLCTKPCAWQSHVILFVIVGKSYVLFMVDCEGV